LGEISHSIVSGHSDIHVIRSIYSDISLGLGLGLQLGLGIVFRVSRCSLTFIGEVDLRLELGLELGLWIGLKFAAVH
jgi:hypothetical protein